MKLFAILYRSLLSTTDNSEKANLILYYLNQTNDEEKITSIQLILFGKSGAVMSTKSMTKLIMERLNISENLMKECYNACQDWVETCSLIAANPGIEYGKYSLTGLLNIISKGIPDPALFCLDTWKSVSLSETWLFNKIITGTLRPLLSKAQFSSLIAEKWNVDQEIIQLRLCLYNLNNIVFSQLIVSMRNGDEHHFLPYFFTHPNEAYINFSLEKLDEYTIQKFIYGERLLLIKKGYNLIAYTIKGEWTLPIPASWHKYIPDQSQLEIIISEEKTWIVRLPLWRGIKSGSPLVSDWINENDLGDQIAWIPNMEVNEWSKIYHQGDIILKHKKDFAKWYRIKPIAHTLTAVLWYAEMPVNSYTMHMKLSLAILSTQKELITICQLSSTEMSETDQTRLYYWIKNNAIQKFGPVRTVRTTQFFTLSYDRVRHNKRSKIGYELINVKIVEWLKDSVKNELSGVADIRT